jgi:hypothetical protein
MNEPRDSCEVAKTGDGWPLSGSTELASGLTRQSSSIKGGFGGGGRRNSAKKRHLNIIFAF